MNPGGGSLIFDAIINGSQFQAQINAMEQMLRSLGERTRKESSEIEKLARRVATAVGGYLSISAASDFIQKMIQVRGEFQQLEVAFSTMLKSKEKADQLLADVAELAAKTPFGLQDAAKGTKQLLAYGFQAEEIVTTLTTLGNVASGVSAPLNDIVYLYGTLKTQGRAYSQDIKQFTGRGIPIIAELAKQFNVSAEEVNDLVAAGKVGFPEIEKAFNAMTGEGGIFFNLMQEQSKTLVGQISNLGDAFDMMLNNLGKENEGIFNNAISGLTYLVEHYQDVINILEVLIVTYGTYKAAVIAVTVVEKVRTVLMGVGTAGLGAMTLAEYLHLQALTLTEKAQKILNATMLNNPYVLLATVLAALTTALLVMGKAIVDVKSKEELLANATHRISDAVDDAKSNISPYVKILQDLNSTEAERLVAYNKLAAIDKKLVEGINAKSVAQDQLNKNVNAYIDALRRQASFEVDKDALVEAKRTIKKLQDLKNAEQDKIDKGSTVFPFNATESAKIFQKSIDNYDLKIQKQREIADSIGKEAVQEEAKAAATNLTNAQLIAQAKSLNDIDAVIEKITKDRKDATSYKEILRLTNDQLAADKKRSEIDLYSNQKKSAKEAVNEGNKLKTLLDQITELEAKATSVNDGKEDGTTAKIQHEVDKLINKAKALKAGDGVVLRITRAGKIIIDDSIAKAAARDLQNKVNTELSNVNIKISESTAGTDNELSLRKEAIAKRVELDLSAAKQQYATDVKSQEALQAKLNEIKANGRREALDLDKEYARAAVDAQLQAIRSQADSKNILDQRIINDPTSTVNQRYQAQERILNRNKAALLAMLNVLETFSKTGLGNTKELNAEMGQLRQEVEGVNSELINTGKQHLIEIFEQLAKVLSTSSAALRGFASDLADINPGLSDTLNIMADLTDNIQQISGVAGVLGQVKGGKLTDKGSSALGTIGGLAGTGATIGGALTAWLGPGAAVGAAVGAVIGALAGVVTQVLKGGKKVRESLQKTYEAIYAFQVNQELGEYRINALLRQRNLIKAQEIDLTLKNLKAQKEVLIASQQTNKSEQDKILAQLQNESFISGVEGKKRGGFLGLWRKTDPINQYASLLGMTFDQIEKLYQNGQLDGRAKALFEQLQQLQQEGADINKQLEDLKAKAQEVFTGTTADSITDSIIQGFQNGLYSAESFAGNFEDLMRKALLNSLKYQYLQEPLKAFYEQFAKDAESNGGLDKGEIENLRNKYNDIVKNFGDQFKQLEDVTGVKLGGVGNDQNTLSGAIKGMTEQQADLLAGQFGGLRINMVQQVQICTQQLTVLNQIESNTANLSDIRADIRSLKTQGIKLIK